MKELKKNVATGTDEVSSLNFPVTKAIMEQYEKVRQLGRFNMLEVDNVQYSAFHDFAAYDLVNFITNYDYQGYYYLLENYSRFMKLFKVDKNEIALEVGNTDDEECY
jgi:hypothetical protein